MDHVPHQRAAGVNNRDPGTAAYRTRRVWLATELNAHGLDLLDLRLDGYVGSVEAGGGGF